MWVFILENEPKIKIYYPFNLETDLPVLYLPSDRVNTYSA